MGKLMPGLLLMLIWILSGCQSSENTPGTSNIPSQISGASSPSAATNNLGDNPYEFEEAMRQAEGYSISTEIEWYATGKKMTLKRDDPRYAEFIKLFRYSAFGPSFSRISKTTINERQETVAVAVPYAWGYILTFNLKDGSTIWFNCSSENTWYETRDTIYKVGFDEQFRTFLEAMLTGENTPSSPPANISIEPEPGQYLYRVTGHLPE